MNHPKDRIIFPLDVANQAQAKDLIQMLSDHVGMFKVGLELFIHAGPSIISYIHEQSNCGVFLDLKLHDIPTTVKRAMARIGELKVTFATVHCGENRQMLKAAVEGGAGKTGVLAVTVLTSVSKSDLAEAGFEAELYSDLSRLVKKRAQLAKEAGCSGVVCSGLEARDIKRAFGPSFLAVTPGIRPSWEQDPTDDQKRTVTPAQAIENGADYLVIGRPIRDAADPVAAARQIANEIASVSPAL